MSVDQFGHLSVVKERSENVKRRGKYTEGLFIDEDAKLNAQNECIKNGSKPLDNDDLELKEYTDENIGKL